jgi:hypothetical protein
MNSQLTQRLNQILPKITQPGFLSGDGIGSEIACHIFDYPSEYELQVREHLAVMENHFHRHHPEMKVLHLDLLDVVCSHLKDRGYLDKALEMHERKGDSGVLKALRGPVSAEKIRDFIAENHQLSSQNLVLLSGVGSVWPMLRAHSLLNCLHTIMGKTPLVMFYPGVFDGTTLRLFGRISPKTAKAGTKHYYRAFPLIPNAS